MAKPLTALLLAVTLLASLIAASAAEPFSDVPENHWAYEQIQTAVDRGLVNGAGDGRFMPDRQVTGVEFVTMLVRAFYPEEIGGAQTGAVWYQPYVQAASSHGLLTGELSRTAVLEEPINRSQMAVLLSNAVEDADLDGMDSILTESQAARTIPDWDQISDDYRDAVRVTYSLGLIVGTDSAGTFRGDGYMTRAQGAVVMNRADLSVLQRTALAPQKCAAAAEKGRPIGINRFPVLYRRGKIW